ncbi:MAG: septal ring lytic transglycosylase RlpA family protein [Desulfuromonadaceae bacterium]|nr:septal ring lytic transglycosylase RlpA family protein [Desulfuromonadaceae bacterium]
MPTDHRPVHKNPLNQAAARSFYALTGSLPLIRWLAPGAALLFITSCGGGPTSSVIETPQTRGLKGWEKPYIVAGQRYDPLRQHEGYVEEGIASWYGRDFHGRKTSNGEIYDMHAMTAAHKTLPLGIFVKVRHLGNGREIVVRLNDRGPFVKGRVIDLSYSAARRLGIDDAGTGPVRIEALGYREKGNGGAPVYRPPASYVVGSYAVQVGAFEAPVNAHRLAAEMRDRFGAATVSEGWAGGRRFHRVWVGRFDTLEAAEIARLRLERNGYPSSFVVALE